MSSREDWPRGDLKEIKSSRIDDSVKFNYQPGEHSG